MSIERELSKSEDRFSEMAERSVLGGMIVEPSLIGSALLKGLREEDFYFAEHGKLFGLLVFLYGERGEGWDDVVLLDYAERMGIEVSSGFVYELVEEASSGVLWEEAVRIVKEKSFLRKVQEVSLKLLQAGSKEEVFSLIERLSGLGVEGEHLSMSDLYSLAQQYADRLEVLRRSERLILGVGTGFLDLDMRTGGFQGKQLVVIGARPGVGKSSLMLSMAMHMAREKRVGIFSLEMSTWELMERMVSMASGIPLKNIRFGHLSDGDWNMVISSLLTLRKLNLFIDETPNLTLQQIKAKTRFYELEVVFVDYLQLIKTDKRNTRQEEVAQISMGLKALSKELDIPVIALAQLNRNSEHRADKRPQLSDLRESGQLEQDADIVLFLHRPDYYKKNAENQKGDAELIIAKNRNGPTGIVSIAFNPDTTLFSQTPQNHKNHREDPKEDTTDLDLDF